MKRPHALVISALSVTLFLVLIAVLTAVAIYFS